MLWYLQREYLKDGTFRVVKAEMETPEGKPVPDPLKSGRWSFNLAAHKAMWRYPWGSVACFYKISKNRLVMTVRIENNSPNTLRGIAVQPLELRFPARPKEWPEGWPRLGHNLGSPTVLAVESELSTLAVVNEDVSRPLLVGFPGRPSPTERPLWAASYNADRWLSPYLDPYLSRPGTPAGATPTASRCGSAGRGPRPRPLPKTCTGSSAPPTPCA